MKLRTPIMQMYYGKLINPDCVSVNTKEHEAFLDEVIKNEIIYPIIYSLCARGVASAVL